MASKINDVRALAATHNAWAIGRDESYRSDGAPVPEPIRRLRELSSEVMTIPVDSPSDPGSSAATLVDIARALTVENVGDIMVGIGLLKSDLSRTVTELARAKAALKVSADVFAALTAGVSPVAGAALSALPPPGKTDDPRLRNADAAKHGPTPTGAICHTLRDGLVLRNSRGNRAIFFAKPDGGFAFRWVAIDGKSTTAAEDAFGVGYGNWQKQYWEEVSSDGIVVTDEPIPTSAGNSATVSAQVEAQTSAAQSAILISDWSPSQKDIETHTGNIATAMTKAGIKLDVTPVLIEDLVLKYKAAKGDQRAQRPGMAFYIWATTQLKKGS